LDSGDKCLETQVRQQKNPIQIEASEAKPIVLKNLSVTVRIGKLDPDLEREKLEKIPTKVINFITHCLF
jgi:hypothetical protein